MENPNDKRIKNDLKRHLDKTAEAIRQHDGWSVINLSELSQKELLEIACKHGNFNWKLNSFTKYLILIILFVLERP